MALFNSKRVDKLSGILSSLRELWLNEKYHDVTLKGSDGVTIGANRAALAAGSDVFQRLLYGKFKESSQEIIEIHSFDGNTIEAVVRFIHDCGVKELRFPYDKSKRDLDIINNSCHVSKLVTLRNAALYFNLPLLVDEVCVSLSNAIIELPLLAYPVLAALAPDECGSSPMKELRKFALCIARFKRFSDEEDWSKVVRLLSSSVLDEILRDGDCSETQFRHFHTIQLWAEPRNMHDTDKNRRTIACGLVKKHIRLEAFDRSLLTGTVANSGLVQEEEVSTALNNQSRSSRERDGNLVLARYCAVWKTTFSDCFSLGSSGSGADVLLFPPITTGSIFQWVVELEGAPGNGEEEVWCWLGIASARKNFEFDGSRRRDGGCWLFSGNNGGIHRFIDGEQSLESLFDDPTSVVTMTLDLMEDHKGNGTLSASFQGGETETVCSNLNEYLIANGGGFLPAVYLKSAGRVRLLVIKKLQKHDIFDHLTASHEGDKRKR